ncbi:uncharacterized protein LOC130668744 [Microplitis mediator]|uniref:uncharacterized protein LOC130668744 n=1 Tax=Microplitis mediator TaxID=375433 RepID=UPI00255453EA|nr:uncharacterized protein LOC130668744 [Microplitis mediator]
MAPYNLVETCGGGCKVRTYKPYLERIKYLVRLPNDKKLGTLALIGTHSSLSYNVDSGRSKTQDLTISQQLKYGIRVLDIGIRPQSNLFKIYTEYGTTDTEFSDTLSKIDDFLDDNPGEFIIALLHQVYPSAYDVTESNCAILDDYIHTFSAGKRLVKNWQLDDTIGQHRGKVLIASMGNSFSGCSFDLNCQCLIQNDDILHIIKTKAQTKSKKTKVLFDLQDKWAAIHHLIRDSLKKPRKCYLNDISYWDGVHNRRAISREGNYAYKENCSMALNHIVTEYFENPRQTFIIVMADYPTQELMDKINDSNFPNSSWRSGWH